METQRNLEKDTVEAARELIQINADSHLGFLQAADAIKDDSVGKLFCDIAKMRKDHARDLQRAIGSTESLDGSFKGKMHRWWIDVRGSLQDGDRYAILAEAERGEDEIKQRYEDLMKENPGNALSSVLHKQFAEVKTHHDMIRDMRDRAKNAKNQ